MDSNFDFLDSAQAKLLHEVLARRNQQLLEEVAKKRAVSEANAEDIMSALSDELTDNLDDDWEPTQHGQRINSLLARFNAARVGNWPR